MSLSHQDIYRLVQEPSSTIRADIARKVASGYCASGSTASANQLALDILRLLLNDTAAKVRKAMAEELRDNKYAPHDVMVHLARDEFDIAEDILQYSTALLDSDLLDIIANTTHVQRLTAICNRQSVSANVSHALINTHRLPVVKTLLNNHHAIINEPDLREVLDGFHHNQSILEAMVYRGNIPYSLAETLYHMVSDSLRRHMTKRHYLPRTSSDKLLSNSRETAILQFLSPWMSDNDTIELVGHMHQKNRLHDSLIIRALCMGELAFFEAAIAKRADIPLANARKLLLNSGISGFKALYNKSKLHTPYCEAIRLIMKIVREELQHSPNKSTQYFNNINNTIERNDYVSVTPHLQELIHYFSPHGASTDMHMMPPLGKTNLHQPVQEH